MKAVWLNEKALAVIDSMFWIAERESYVGESDLPTWNQIRMSMGAPRIVHDWEHGYLPEDDPRVGTPFRKAHWPPAVELEGVTTITQAHA